MNTTDFSGARSALATVLNAAGPVIAALQQGDQVLASIQNAEKHNKALAREVADLQNIVGKLKAESYTADEALKRSQAALLVAEQESAVRIAAVKAAEVKAVADAKKDTADAVAKIRANATKVAQECSAAATQQQTAAAMAATALQQREQELVASVTALETKLEKLKAQAQKFAASLTAA